ncbi:SapC family protein [Pacificimonas sp. WHA3]|uniref:SapC family protein n=1 Tax=Pacificimonas pallii TaxID=2827236 RepID=A0ABS6SDL4_9SPHN|nr:SapC family protein [Pacificimonas pallii]MBV7256509.1 SapC family protein [Pacificimonas pallii]
MATTPENGAAPAAQLPLFYKSLTPLSSQAHKDYGIDERSTLEFVKGIHAVPITVDEFAAAQRHFPIIFSGGDTPAPLVLMGLQEGQNFYVNDDGTWKEGVYVPAYIRRYPFMLARIRQDSEELSLCFDDMCEDIGEKKAQAFFDGDQPSQVTKNVLGFCEEYEKSINRTRAFTEELKKQELLMSGEVSIQPPGDAKPSIYRGFQMVNEDKLKELRGDQARKLVQNGGMPLIYAHLLSVHLIRELFAKANPADSVPLSNPTDQGIVPDA